MIVFILSDFDQNWQCLVLDNKPKPWENSLMTPINGKPKSLLPTHRYHTFNGNDHKGIFRPKQSKHKDPSTSEYGTQFACLTSDQSACGFATSCRSGNPTILCWSKLAMEAYWQQTESLHRLRLQSRDFRSSQLFQPLDFVWITSHDATPKESEEDGSP